MTDIDGFEALGGPGAWKPGDLGALALSLRILGTVTKRERIASPIPVALLRAASVLVGISDRGNPMTCMWCKNRVGGVNWGIRTPSQRRIIDWCVQDGQGMHRSINARDMSRMSCPSFTHDDEHPGRPP